MLVSEFVEVAGFPERWQEKHLQQYLGRRLQELGYAMKLEVGCNGGRADIVTNWLDGAIIEVKKYLDRNTIYQAVGQLKLYGLNNERKLVVMGFLTTASAEEQRSALSTALMVQQDPRVTVIFVNLEPEWQPGHKAAHEILNFKFKFNLASLPSLSLPKLNLQWCFGLALSHPLIIVLAIALVLSSIPSLQSPANLNHDTKQQRQIKSTISKTKLSH